VLKEEFPNAVILYCQWHVIKAMFKGMSDCRVEKSDRDECRRIIRLLVHAKTEVEYNDLKQELFDEVNDDFKAYFERNWEKCRSMWVTFERDQNMHFANTTNSRLESHNQKLKDLTFCEGKDPSRITYCQDSLRSHFQGCLEKKVILSFESGQSPYNPGPFMKSRFKV